ncbi:MAG: YciI family protein [Balneolales bacterium]|nr:YciI family protein [Balneolales bacterium]
MRFNKWIALIFILLLIAQCGKDVNSNSSVLSDEDAGNSETASVFDEELAASLGADDYGMRLYVMAFLKTGPNQNHSAEEVAELQRGHMNHIRAMAENGDLILAGPFVQSPNVRGILLFDTDSIELARELTAADPAVKAGRLSMELHSWYGSAALIQVPELHKKIERVQI